MSISHAFAMLLGGFNGTTKQQLEKTLGFVKNEQLYYNLKALGWCTQFQPQSSTN